MIIKIIVPANLSEDNGITVRAKRIREAIQDEYDVSVISSRNRNFDKMVTLIREIVLWELTLLYKLSRERADCIYCCSDFFGFLGCYLFSKFYHINIIFEAHGILSEENKFKGRSQFIIQFCALLERFVVSHADYVIALSIDIYNYYKKYNNNIEVIPAFLNEDEPPGASLHEDDGKKRVGLIGPFDMPANKYFLDYIYNNINDFDKRISFVVIGMCNHRIEHKRIEYTGYIQSREKYMAKLASLDSLIVPSNTSTTGPLNKILEAMSCSLPVFTTPKGLKGLDNVENGKSILVFEENELADKINELIFKDGFLDEIRGNARIVVENHYSKRKNIKRLLNIIGESLN